VKKRAADARRERRRFWGIRGSFAGAMAAILEHEAVGRNCTDGAS
jgi:hypothetical protein